MHKCRCWLWFPCAYLDLARTDLESSLTRNVFIWQVHAVSLKCTPLETPFRHHYAPTHLQSERVTVKSPHALWTRITLDFKTLKWTRQHPCRSYRTVDSDTGRWWGEGGVSTLLPTGMGFCQRRLKVRFLVNVRNSGCSFRANCICTLFSLGSEVTHMMRRSPMLSFCKQ